MILPTRVEPVKFTRRTALCRISASTTSGASLASWVMTLMTPLGRPASTSTWPINRCVPGHISEALNTTVLPQAMAMATARVPRITGAFHGAMPTQTPTGWRTAMARVPGLSDGMISPVIWVVSAPASRSMLAASMTLKPAHGPVAPVSSMTRRVNSSTLAAMMSAARVRMARRSPGPVWDQAGKAAAAHSMAASTSAARAAAARVAGLPVKGSMRVKLAPPTASRTSPPINNPISMMVSSSSKAAGQSAARSEFQYLGIDRGLEAAVGGKVGAINPASAVGAKEGDDRRDVAGGTGAADAGNVAIDAGIAQDFAELPEDRGFDRAGADGVDADAARLEQRLMGGTEGPEQQQLL